MNNIPSLMGGVNARSIICNSGAAGKRNRNTAVVSPGAGCYNTHEAQIFGYKFFIPGQIDVMRNQ
jgi:hypothetical protein